MLNNTSRLTDSNKKSFVARRKRKGFSLIELVIVIAILAVLAAVLAPALIHYVEDSRATSDIHSMDEVVNAVQIGLANPEAYDEMVDASVDGNVSCYIDSNSESGRDKEIVKVGANGTAYYTFDDDNRLLDEVPYTAAGNMHGVTITFIPNTSSENLTYDVKNAVINKHVGGTALLSDYPNLYNRVRQTIGDTVTLSSNTYGNSEYTIFIRIGSRGSSQQVSQDPIQVYGQYNGTNLPKSYTSGGTAADRDDTYTPPTNTNPPSGGGIGTGGTPVTPPPPVGGGTGTESNEPTNPPTEPEPEPEPDNNIYYLSLKDAAKEMKDGTIGQNQNATSADGTCCIILENNVATIKLMKETTVNESLFFVAHSTYSQGYVDLNGQTVTVNGRGSFIFMPTVSLLDSSDGQGFLQEVDGGLIAFPQNLKNGVTPFEIEPGKYKILKFIANLEVEYVDVDGDGATDLNFYCNIDQERTSPLLVETLKTKTMSELGMKVSFVVSAVPKKSNWTTLGTSFYQELLNEMLADPNYRYNTYLSTKSKYDVEKISMKLEYKTSNQSLTAWSNDEYVDLTKLN